MIPRSTIFAAVVALSQVFVLGTSSSARAQSADGSPHVTLLPGGLLFQPLLANHQEPHVGLRKHVGSSRMKLDIGSSLDLLEYRLSREKAVRMGADFFTYALSTNSQGLRLQIDAVDGFFGGHVTYTDSDERGRYKIRLRILHLSAHFLDGHYDQANRQWKDGRAPLPFTKDFGELVGAYEWTGSSIAVMAYSGLSYATLVRPTDIARIASLHGLEAHTAEPLCQVLERPFNIYVADNFTLVGIPAYIGTNNVEIGVKFGTWDSAGIRLYGSYHSGLDMFSQYYNVRRDHWGVGFAFDFW